jgi:muramidase (phage lysozyme)
LSRYWTAYRKQLDLKDFSPINQDRVALQQIKERRALPDIQAGRIAEAVAKCRNIWASLPGAGYGQHEHKLDDLLSHYIAAGGALA